MAVAGSHRVQRPNQRRPDGEERWLPVLGATIWDSLPLLLAIDLMLCVAALPAMILAAAGAGIAAPVAAALTLGPLWLGALESGRRLLAGEAVTVHRYVVLSREHAGRGLALAIVPAVAMMLLLGTVTIMGHHPDEPWLIAPLVMNGCLAMLALLAGSWVFPLATLTRARGRALWRLALVATGSVPLATLGTVALLVFLWLSWRFLGPLVPLALAAPFALYLAALGNWWCNWAKRKVSGDA